MGLDEDLFDFEDEYEPTNPTDIKVVGSGGAGNNALARMKDAGIQGVEFIAVNTDLQDLENTPADISLPIGHQVTEGLGSGGDPNVGLKSAQESRDKIKEAVEGADLLILTAGMGGGTGTGATPVIAEIAEDLDVLTIGIVTRPFDFEESRRRKYAEKGIGELRKHVDSLIVIPNDRIFDVIDDDEELHFTEAFTRVDEVLYQAVQGISEVILKESDINLDFADVQTVLQDRGDALFGVGEASGEDAAMDAARQAVDCPLLETNGLKGAEGLLVSISGGSSLTTRAVRDVSEFVGEMSNVEDVDMFVGPAHRPEMKDSVRVIVVAAGFPSAGDKSADQSGSTSKNVVDIEDINPPSEESMTAQERREKFGDVEIVDSEPVSDDAEDEDDDDDFDTPAFLRNAQ